MVIYEDIGNDLVRAYSDRKVYILGGFPEGKYEEAIDPKSLGRTYTETDEPIVEEDEGGEEC